MANLGRIFRPAEYYVIRGCGAGGGRGTSRIRVTAPQFLT
jgi:hypothetical protein